MRIKFMKSEFVVFAFGLVAFSAVAALPTGFTELKYLKGSGAQRIELDYTPAPTDVIEAKVRLSSKDGPQYLWCSRGNGYADRSLSALVTDRAFRIDKGSLQVSTPSTLCQEGVVTTIRADYGARRVFVNGGDTGVTLGDDTMTAGASQLYLFCSHVNGSEYGDYGKYYLYSFKVYNSSGVLVREYIPARKNDVQDGEVGCHGVYETKTGVFCPNSGSTQFTVAVKSEYEIEVPAGTTHTITTEEVAAMTGKDLVKTGGGVLECTSAMASFTGDIFVKDGILRNSSRDSFGTSSGAIFVADGASLHNTVSSGNNSGYYSLGDGKAVYTEGSGYCGFGAITNSAQAETFVDRWYLTGPTFYASEWRADIRYGQMHAFRNKLTVKTYTNRVFAFVATASYPCDIDVLAGWLNIQDCSSGSIAGSTNDIITIPSGGRYYLWRNRVKMLQTMRFADGASFEAAMDDCYVPGVTSFTNHHAGAFELAGNLTYKAGNANSFIVSGPVSGPGGITLDAQSTSWLQLENSNNSFKGGVCLPAGKGNLALKGNGSMPADAPLKAFGGTQTRLYPADGWLVLPSDGKSWPSVDASARSFDLGIAELTDDAVVDAESFLSVATNAHLRSLLVKNGTGAGAAVLKGAVAVADTTVDADATLRLVPGALGGLNWWFTSYELNRAGNMTSTTPSAEAYAMGIDPSGCTYAYRKWFETSGAEGASTHNQSYLYKGYIRIPGEKGTKVTFNLITSIARHVSVWIDGKLVAWTADNQSYVNVPEDTSTFNYTGWSRLSTYKRQEMEAGWKSIEILMHNSWNRTAGAQGNTDKGWTENFGIGIDWLGRCETNAEYYVKLQDPGDGSFLRPYREPPADVVSAPVLVGSIAGRPGATVDLGGTVQSPAEIGGVPAVSNGTLNVGSRWTLDCGDIAANAPMTVGADGVLNFPAAVTVDLSDAETEETIRYGRNYAILSVDPSVYPSETVFTASQKMIDAKMMLISCPDEGKLYVCRSAGMILYFR